MDTEIPNDQDGEICPKRVVEDVKESLKQADEGKLTPYTRIKDMLKSIIH